MPSGHSLKTRLIAAFLALMGVALAVLVFYILPRIRDEAVESARKNQRAAARQLAETLGAEFSQALAEIEQIAHLPALCSLDPGRMDAALTMINAANRFFNYYFAMDSSGRWLSYPTRSDLVGQRIPPENMSWVKTTMNAASPVFLDVVKSRVGTLVSGIAAPIIDANGNRSALLRGVITVSRDNALVRPVRNVTVGDRGYAFLVASDGRLLAHPEAGPQVENYDRGAYRDLAPVRRAIHGETGTIRYAFEGIDWVAAFQPVPVTGWAVIVQQPIDDIMAGAQRQVRLIVWTFALTFFLAGAFTVLMLNIALRPMSALLDQIRSGRPTGQQTYPMDEIGQIARQYDALYADLFESRAKIQRSEEKFRTLFDSASDAIFIHDLNGRFLEVNHAACTRLGYRRDELLTMQLADLNIPEAVALIAPRLKELEMRSALLFENVHQTRDGRRIPVEVHARTVTFEGQTVGLSIVRDITERKSAESALRDSEERFRVLVQELPFGVALLDAQGTLEYRNPAFGRIFGYRHNEVTAIEHWFPRAYPDPDYRQQVEQAWRETLQVLDDRTIQRQFRVRCGDGTDKEILFRTRRLTSNQILTLYEDITEQKRLEAQFQQAQKMEAIGTLAGGIAHDFNNLLMGILGHATLMRTKTDPHAPACEHLAGIEQHVERAAELTKQLLGFARAGKYAVQPTGLNDLIRSTADLFGRTKKEIRIHRQLATDLWTVAVDRVQIEQVLLNIFVNAWQAMAGGGDLSLATRNVVLDDRLAVSFNRSPGRYVEITIGDTGPGIPPEVQKRIFEPFFTTKPKGHGTGLGLASAYGIVKNHNGYILVDSASGQGACFTIGLPATDAPAAGVDPPPLVEAPLHGQGTVLLVDDEAMILDVGRQMLESLGYTVLTATSGQEALDTFKNHDDRVDLVILDLIMPGMDGQETFEHLRAIVSDVRVLVASGYSQNGDASRILTRGGAGFIQKPFNLAALSHAVHQAMGR